MRILAVLAMLVPMTAAAKYDGVRYQRDPVVVAIAVGPGLADEVRQRVDGLWRAYNATHGDLPRSPFPEVAIEASVDAALQILARSPHARRALVVVGSRPYIDERAEAVRAHMYTMQEPLELAATFAAIAEQPALDRVRARQPSEPPPWRAYGALAIAIAMLFAVRLARPR